MGQNYAEAGQALLAETGLQALLHVQSPAVRNHKTDNRLPRDECLNTQQAHTSWTGANTEIASYRQFQVANFAQNSKS
jgi:hypothetical protein